MLLKIKPSNNNSNKTKLNKLNKIQNLILSHLHGKINSKNKKEVYKYQL